MKTKILDGKKLREKIRIKLGQRVEGMRRTPVLAIVSVKGADRSDVYIREKIKFGASIGVKVRNIVLPADCSASELLDAIKAQNQDNTVDGVIVQMPLPFSDLRIFANAVNPQKDVDGLTDVNLGKILAGAGEGILAATARGVITLLREYDESVDGKKVLIIGRSTLVGRPLAAAMLALNATVTVAHSRTANIREEIRSADIVVVAAGVPNLIRREDVRSHQVIVDVGISLVDGEKIEEEIPTKNVVGDVAFDEVRDSVSAISPVPGGVGPMTVASLFENLLDALR
ncbi:MAG: hypothetical protein A2928_01600 [Candidatus Taylorbacteria bacterium RIFCSPLOWO2_01_FULL_45_15b]|uniref:Bifunctional protein FolD n=1 Tax=Candidatus Taylorbacteria bacterium RIFCSPLOWO2_01_FULL_45_15b TaxID=1802319 RepID=A0A1G2NBS2_9BACT|nr:MAG: hypothetical protein A2928_01600 [Candidatus Taylorbacteria bacterium RIFCSPLOWO2_01_FULL_45_15b]